LSDTAETELAEKRIRLLLGLAKATKNGSIEWDSTSEEDTFVAEAGISSIQIIDETLKAGSEPADYGKFHISIFDNSGVILDSFSSIVDSYYNSHLNNAVIVIRAAINGSLAKQTSKRLDAVLEAIGA